jgi:hypothetical protein
VRSIARRFFTDLIDFKPEDLTLNNYTRINDAEKLYSMFGNTLFNYQRGVLSDDTKGFTPTEVSDMLPHRYTIDEMSAVHSLSTVWFVFVPGDFMTGLGFNGAANDLRKLLHGYPDLVLLSTNGLNLMQTLHNGKAIKITYCTTPKQLKEELKARCTPTCA